MEPHTRVSHTTNWQTKGLRGPNLEEAADVDFVVCVHEDHVLKEPEEGLGVLLTGLQQLQDPVELKEESPGALCRTHTVITPRRSTELGEGLGEGLRVREGLGVRGGTHRTGLS